MQYRFALATIIKNEAWDIREWIAFHVLQGVEHFFLYDNESTDELADQLASIPEGLLTIIAFPGHGVQIEAYAHFLTNFGHLCEYAAMIDADEYLCGLDKKKLEDLITPDVSGVALNWLNYASSGHIKRPSGLVIDAFSHRPPAQDPQNRHFKCIYRTADILAPANHQHTTEMPVVDLLRRQVTAGYLNGVLPSEDVPVTLRHYPLKSFSHFCKKVARQDVLYPYKYAKLAYFRTRDKNDVFAPIDPACSDAVSKLLATYGGARAPADQEKFDAIAELLHPKTGDVDSVTGPACSEDEAYGYAPIAEWLKKPNVEHFFRAQITPARAAFLDNAELAWSLTVAERKEDAEVCKHKDVIIALYRAEKNAVRVLRRLLEALEHKGDGATINSTLCEHAPSSFKSAPNVAVLGDLAEKYGEAALAVECYRRAEELAPGLQHYADRHAALWSKCPGTQGRRQGLAKAPAGGGKNGGWREMLRRIFRA